MGTVDGDRKWASGLFAPFPLTDSCLPCRCSRGPHLGLFVPELRGPPQRDKQPSYLLLGTIAGSLALSYLALQLQRLLQALPSLLCIPRGLGLQLTHLPPLPLVLSFQCPYLGLGQAVLRGQGPSSPNNPCLFSHALHLGPTFQGHVFWEEGLGSNLSYSADMYLGLLFG